MCPPQGGDEQGPKPKLEVASVSQRLSLRVDAFASVNGRSYCLEWGFPGGSVVRNLPANAGDVDSTPASGTSPRGGHGNPLQYSCLENPMDRGAQQATVHGVETIQTQLIN